MDAAIDYGDEAWLNLTLSMVMTQYGVKAGLRKFGDKGTAAVLKEVRQLHDMGVVSPVHPTTEQKQMALMYLMFLKEKIVGSIKGRGCADGRPQRKTMSNIEASSRTLETESVMITCIRDGYEGRWTI